MEKLGTIYGGWKLPCNLNLDENSIVYSIGVGEDISFDLLLQCKYKSKIFLIDPTDRAFKHFNEIQKYYESHIWQFSGDIQKDYKQHIEYLNPDFSKFTYLNIGAWNSTTQLKFYKQHNPQYVSQSVIQNIFGNEYDTINVTTIKNIMERHNHTKIDIVKMDIEGAEVAVLHNMLDDNILPRYLCIEFDLYLKNKDYTNETQKIINRLLEKYTIFANDEMNMTLQLIHS